MALDDGWLQRRYEREGATVAEIAAESGAGISTIYRHLANWG